MSQQTEISFPLLQTQTFNADQKKSIHPGKKPPEALKKNKKTYSKEIFWSRKGKKKVFIQDFHQSIIY